MRKDTVLFIFPALIIIVVFLIFPITQSVYLSFFSSSGEFVGLRNYADVLSSKKIINLSNFPKWPPMGALIHNLIWIVTHLPLSLLLGLGFAVILRNVKGASVIKPLIFLGMVVPMVVGGILVRFLFSKRAGMVSNFFHILGLEQLYITWVAHPETSLFALILTSAWLWTGFSMVVYLAALTTIPKEYHESAEIDGATPFQKFYYITLPLLKPATGIVIIMSVIWELKLFDIIYTATMGGPGGASNVMPLETYLTAFRYFDIGHATAMATILTLITVIPMLFMIRAVVVKK